MRLRTVAILSAIAFSSTPALAGPLNLICLGAGAANRVAQTQAWASNNQGGSATANVMSRQTVGFDDQVMVEIDGAVGRIRMPRAMLPPVRGGRDGWFEIKNVRTTDDEITGTIQVNVLNSPKLRLDRLQGMIAINGKAGDFTGRCEPYDPAMVQRRF